MGLVVLFFHCLTIVINGSDVKFLGIARGPFVRDDADRGPAHSQFALVIRHHEEAGGQHGQRHFGALAHGHGALDFRVAVPEKLQSKNVRL